MKIKILLLTAAALAALFLFQVQLRADPVIVEQSGNMVVTGEDIAPMSLSAKENGMEIMLRWTEKKQGCDYEILRATEPDGEYIRINKEDLRGNYYDDNEINSVIPPLSGIKYYYRISARDKDGNASETADVVSAVPVGQLMPPTDLAASANLLKVNLRWSQPAATGNYDLKGYYIYRSENETEPGRKLNTEPVKETVYTDDGEITGLNAGTKYFYTVQSVDVQGNTSDFSARVYTMPYSVVSGPVNVTALPVSSQSIKISWDDPDMAGTYGIDSYNILRSTDPVTFSDTPINIVPFKPYRDEIGRVFYYDNMVLSKTPPDTGVKYYYKIVPVDSLGNSGAASEVVSSKIDIIELPKSGIISANISEYGLPADSNLKISGMKSIKIGYTDSHPYNSSISKFVFDQRFRVLLNGSIGKKILVDVNYDDSPDLQTSEYTKINITYNGDKEEVIQEASFGDITLNLPYTKWASYTQTLFGIKGRVKLGDKFEFIGIGAQTKGLSDTTSFTGNLRKKQTNGKDGIEILDTAFYDKQYYYITKDPAQVNALMQDIPANPVYIKPGTVIIYVDDNNAQLDDVNTVYSYPNGAFHFNKKILGSDYTVDYRTGLIRFNISIGNEYSIAVAYETTDGQRIGFAADGSIDLNEANLISAQSGYTASGAHLIQDGRVSNPLDVSHRSMNIYYIGETQIENPTTDRSFVIKIKKSTGEDVPGFVLPQPYEASASKYYEIDADQGLLKFKSFYPFTVDPSPVTYPGDYTNNTRSDSAVDCYAGSNQRVNFKIYLEYSYRVSSYRVDNFPVVFGSERVFVDGRLLKKDTDYYILYETGDITFVDSKLIQPNTKIEISYEYLQSFMTYQNNVAGARAEYKLLDNMTLGSTFLYKGSNPGTTVPDARSGKERLSTPAQLWMLDADVKLKLDKKQVNAIISALPLVDNSELPVEINSQAETAYSDFNVNIFEKNKEKGVAMIDGMEGADNVVAMPTNRLAWFPSSAPNGLLTGNRVYMTRDNVTEAGHAPVDPNSVIGTNSTQMLKINFSGLTSDNWDSFRYVISPYGDNLNQYNYLEMWVYVESNSPVRVGFDVGIISEDSNGNGQLRNNVKNGNSITRYDSEDVDNNGTYLATYDVGIGSGTYPDNQSYWGGGNQQLDTEDMDKDGQLDTNEVYYRFAPYGPRYSFGNELELSPGWHNIKLPLNKFTDSYGLTGTQSDPANNQFMSVIKHLRMYITGSGATPSQGHIKIESLQFTGNSWKLRAKKGAIDLAGNAIITPDVSKIDALAVSQNVDGAYVPNTAFFDYQKEEDKKAEEGLRIKFNLSALDNASGGLPIHYLTKFLTNATGYDYGQYKKIKFDVLYKQKKQSAGSGRMMFIRLGSGAADPGDENRYYQYNVQLDTIPVDNGWHTVEFLVDGSDGKRSPAVGDPNLRSIQYITLGFINPNNTTTDDIVYVNNIRLTDPIAIQGSAKRVETTVQYEGLGTVNHEYQETDSDFNTILDMDRSQRKQHYVLNRARFDYNQISFLPVSNEASRSEVYTEDKHRNDFAYTNDNNSADVYTDNYRNTVSYSSIPGLSLSNVTSLDKVDMKYPGTNAYLNAKTTTFRVNPTANYSLTTQVLGDHRFSNSVSFTDVNYDYYTSNTSTANVSGTGYYDQWNMTVDETHTWDGSYRLGQIAVTPAFAYTLRHQKGNLNGVYYHYGKLGQFNYSGKYLPINRVITPRFNVTGGELWLFNPRFEYTDSYTLDYSQNLILSTGSIRLNSPVAFSKLLSFIPDISNLAVSVSDSSRKFDERVSPGSFAQFNKMPFEKQWNLYLLSYLYDENAVNESEAKSDSGSIDRSVTLDLSEIKIFEKLRFSPEANYSRRRYSQQRSVQSLSDSLSMSVRDIYVDNVTVPFLDFLIKDEKISGSYTYSESKTYDPADVKKDIRATYNHTWSVSLPYTTSKTGDGLNGSIGVTGGNNVIKDLKLKTWTWNYTPTLAMNYAWRISNPITIPSFIPWIGGKNFKFENSLNFTANLGVTVQNGDNDDPKKALAIKQDNQTYTADLGVNYNVLRNISAELRANYKQRVDKIQTGTLYNYSSIGGTLEVKVEF